GRRHPLLPAERGQRAGRLGAGGRRTRLDAGERPVRADRDPERSGGPPAARAGQDDHPVTGRDDHPMTVRVECCLPDGFLAEALRADARAGLSATPKVLPPKWFYDERGSELFEKITRLDEYYPTRAERPIPRAAAGPIAAATRAQTLVELGAGAADKTRLLLDALAAKGTLASFVPVDVSETALTQAARRVEGEYPGLAVTAVVSDFEE